VGIVGSRVAGTPIVSTIIYSNRSSAALFGHAFTIDRWHAYFGAKHLPVLYFQLDPQQFVPAIAAPAIIARWVPTGLNVVGDMYAGDARHPDFAQIRAAGITAFIHKATDPIYSFNADLYNSRKEQALRAGLLWAAIISAALETVPAKPTPISTRSSPAMMNLSVSILRRTESAPIR
jgi:hypothetical protein